MGGNNSTTTNAMNEWGFIGQDILVGIGKFATSNKFKNKAWLYARREVSAF